jgi:hypothetical protein
LPADLPYSEFEQRSCGTTRPVSRRWAQIKGADSRRSGGTASACTVAALAVAPINADFFDRTHIGRNGVRLYSTGARRSAWKVPSGINFQFSTLNYQLLSSFLFVNQKRRDSVSATSPALISGLSPQTVSQFYRYTQGVAGATRSPAPA